MELSFIGKIFVIFDGLESTLKVESDNMFDVCTESEDMENMQYISSAKHGSSSNKVCRWLEKGIASVKFKLYGETF